MSKISLQADGVLSLAGRCVHLERVGMRDACIIGPCIPLVAGTCAGEQTSKHCTYSPH